MGFRKQIAGLVALALAAAAAGAAAARESLEYPVKAAFLYRFGSFVDWPATAFADDAAPLTVCVVGRDPFGPVLDRTVKGQTIGARAIVVRRLATVSAGAGCHIAYLGGSAEQSAADAAKALSGEPVLTVTDGARAEGRGAINFVVLANRVRFEIDQRLAAQGGLAISSKLLNLAVGVAR